MTCICNSSDLHFTAAPTAVVGSFDFTLQLISLVFLRTVLFIYSSVDAVQVSIDELKAGLNSPPVDRQLQPIDTQWVCLKMACIRSNWPLK